MVPSEVISHLEVSSHRDVIYILHEILKEAKMELKVERDSDKITLIAIVVEFTLIYACVYYIYKKINFTTK